MPRPTPLEAAPYFFKYIDLAKGDSLEELRTNHAAEIDTFYNSLPDAKADFAYAPNKWTVKELFLHLIDVERIFAYRALRIARKDATPLPGFDENLFAANSNAKNRTLESLKEEFHTVRKSTDWLFESFSNEQLQQTGTVSDRTISVNAIGYIITGHLLHHRNILQERYL